MRGAEVLDFPLSRHLLLHKSLTHLKAKVFSPVKMG